MATADAASAARTDWPLSNPWTWMCAALGTATAALLWVRLLGSDWTPVRFTLLLLALAAVGAALILRLQSRRPAFLNELSPRGQARALALLSAAGTVLAVSALGLLIAGLSDAEWVPWTSASLIFLCALVVPGGAVLAGYYLLRLRNGRPVGTRAESATLLVLAAVTAFLCCWALYVDEAHEGQWFSMRLLLAMAAGAAFLAAPVVLLPPVPRYAVLSVLVLFHFAGIVNAALSAPPAPWLAIRAWTYLYRPYLEFMYLNNAYHFYAPEPGPSGYLVYRILYQRPNGDLHWHWDKIPNMDDRGFPQYAMSLQYQRRIAVLETMKQNDPAPPEMMFNIKLNRWVTNPIYYWRQVNSTNPPAALVGQPEPKATLTVPLHPEVAVASQYQPPSLGIRKLVESFARHLASLPPPDPRDKDDKVVNVKIYRMIHHIAQPEMVIREKPAFDPQAPQYYLPFFLGTFSKDGEMLDLPHFDQLGNLDRGDPFLYWLLPIIRVNPNEDDSAVLNYMLLHAGDRKWVRYPGEKEWSAPREQN